MMKKQIFTSKEAQIVAFSNSPHLVNLQLHQWKERGELLQLKRGLYCFADAKPGTVDVARHLYWPCYFSLEYALSFYGMIPEAVFAYTLVTTNTKRDWTTPFGRFSFRQIQPKAFNGYRSENLMATPEKALVDYFYLNSSRLVPKEDFWEESRLDAEAVPIDFKKVFRWARYFQSGKLISLLKSFEVYAKSQ